MRKLLLLPILVLALLAVGVRPSVHAQAQGCELELTESGAMVTVCPEAESFSDFFESFSLSLFQERVADDTSPLRIESVPSGASVWIDGELFGRTPMETKVEPGSRFVQVLAPGYETQSATVTVLPGRASSRVFQLESTIDVSLLDVPASTFTSFPGFDSTGDFWIDRFIRDKDGVLYVQFFNRVDKVVDFGGLDERAADGTSPPRALQTKQSVILDYVGVAKSEDDGATWELVFSLFDDHDGVGSTSEKLIDSLFAREREDDDPQEHWAKFYVKERFDVTNSIETIMPHPDGGVIIRYFTSTRTTRGIDASWDNFDKIREFYQRTNEPVPERFKFDLRETDRWGISEADLEGSFPPADGGWFVTSPGNFGPTPSNFNGNGQAFEDFRYQGTVEGVHYWYSHEQDNTRQNPEEDGRSRFIYSSEDHGKNINFIAEFEREVRVGPSRREDLRISPQGDFYLVDQIVGTVHAVGDDRYELVNKVPDEFWIPESFDDSTFPPLQALEFDAAGNIHLVLVRHRSQVPGDSNGFAVYHQVVPKDKPEYDRVALITGSSCNSCSDLRDFLHGADIRFSENPELPASATANLETVVAATGYPVIARIRGDEHLFVNGNDRVAVSQAIGASYPSLVDAFVPRRGSTGDGPRWANVLLEGNLPRIVTERADGIHVYQPGPTGWEATRLFNTPPISFTGARTTYTISPGTTPYLPGSHRQFRGRQIDVDFNDPESLDGLRMFYGSGSFRQLRPETPTILEDTDQSSYYLLGSEGTREVRDTGREIMPVSQLIPVATFFVELPAEATVTAVSGELAGYVTEEGVTTVDGRRFYRVVADLRQRGETAVNGSIMSRLIGGAIFVTDEGETVPVSLFLNVDNTRLTAFDAESAYNTVDLTMEAVRFEDSRWIITNNLALTNSIECGDGRIISVGPNSFTSITPANDSEAAALAKCLRGFETDPLNIPNCEAWEDAQLVLSGELIGTLAHSLPLRVDRNGVVNYVQAFGSASFTAHRIVNVSTFAAELGCNSAIHGDPVVVVKIEGEVLADSETGFNPTITVVERGSVSAVTRQASARLTVTQEVAWLEFEAQFLESALIQLKSSDIDARLFGSAPARRIRYLRDINAVRAAVHCGRMGHSVDELLQFLEDRAERPDAIRPDCLQDFFRSPAKYWPTLGTVRTLGTSAIDVMFPGVLKDGFDENPTMAYLKANAEGSQLDWETFFIDRAQVMESRGNPSDVAQHFNIDLALDHYARVRTQVLRSNTDWPTVLGHATLFLNPVQKDVFDGTMTACLSGITDPAPLAFGLENTPTAFAYKAGIPCADSLQTATEREQEYQKFGLGLRDPFLAELLKSSENDFNLLLKNLELVEQILPEMEQRMAGVDPTRINLAAVGAEETEALDLLTMVHMKMDSLTRSKELFLGTALPGMFRCGDGLVRGLFSREAAVFYITTGVAWAAGPITGGASWGVAIPAMTAAGVVLGGQGVYDLSQQWENLSDIDRVSATCQTAIGAIMTVNGVSAAKPVFVKYNSTSLRINPPKKISLASIQKRASTSILKLQDQFKQLATTADVQPLSVRTATQAVLERLRPPTVESLMRGASKPQRKEIQALAEMFDYLDLVRSNPEARAVFEGVIEAIKTNRSGDDIAAVLTRRRAESQAARRADNQALATSWREFGGAVVVELAMTRGKLPRSLSAFVDKGKLLGDDATVIKTIIDADVPPPDSTTTASVFGLRRNDLLLSYIESKRVQDFIKNPTRSEAVYSPLEVNGLRGLARDALGDAFTGQDRIFFDALAKPDIARVINRGITEAAEANGVSVGSAGVLTVDSIAVNRLAAGAFKIVNKIEVKIGNDAKAIELVIKNGAITPDEIAILTELGEKGITAKQYGGELIEGLGTSRPRSSSGRVDSNAISVEEFIPGETWATSARGASEAVEVEIAGAIGDVDGRLLAGTLETRSGQQTAFYNRDLHWGNINIFDDGAGGLKAKIIDYDGTSTFHKVLTDEQWMYSTLMRRHFITVGPRQAVELLGPRANGARTNAYLEGFLRGFQELGGSRQVGIDYLTQASANLKNRSAGSRLAVPEEASIWTSDVVQTTVSSIASQVDSFLAGLARQTNMAPLSVPDLFAVIWKREESEASLRFAA